MESWNLVQGEEEGCHSWPQGLVSAGVAARNPVAPVPADLSRDGKELVPQAEKGLA